MYFLSLVRFANVFRIHLGIHQTQTFLIIVQFEDNITLDEFFA